MKFTKEKNNFVTTDKHGCTQIKSKDFLIKPKKNLCLSVFICGFICLLFCFIQLNFPPQTAAADSNAEIENAIFMRQEFFGSQAIVPLPTAEARENLAKLAANSPDNPQILEKLAELDEKLLRFDEAENNLERQAQIEPSKLENLAEFYERRAQFEKEAETLKTILFSVSAEKRAAIFERLIDLARKHDLKNYLQTDFYAEVARANADIYPVFAQLIENLSAAKNYAEALNFVRQAKIQFPERKNSLLEKEVEILLETDQSQEAEKAYQADFDPFWSNEEAQKFYDFLSGQDRLRVYGAEIRARFRKNPADLDAAVRLALYQNHDYFYGNDSIAPILTKLEQTKKSWTTEELVIISRLLIQNGEADLAARFLYTLYAREDYGTNSELRAKVLYQLFEMFSDAEKERLPITKGDLRFYEDVATADTKPGIATGILSLIFSDSEPRKQFDAQETRANKLFNRAAAFRIFEEYKRENPRSPQLAQMYLDIVRLYATGENTEIAEKTLDEFAANYENSDDFPAVALKLADAQSAFKKDEKAREIYQKTLDYLGKQGKFGVQTNDVESVSEESDEQKSKLSNSGNDGINIPNEADKPSSDDYDYDEKTSNFRDYLGRKTSAVTYREVLEKLVASYAAAKNTSAILSVYSNEIAKYPAQEWLYEQRLTWLEQTNLTAAQLELYKTALAQFQTNNWRDRLARFFVRNKRDQEFAGFSEDLIAKLNDTDAQKFLNEFAGGNAANDFQKGLSRKLYQTAHERFPHNTSFVKGLLRFYKSNKLEKDWQNLAAEYYFESPEIRDEFLDKLAQTNLLRDYLAQSKTSENTIYELFRADASARLSDFENSVAAYRKLVELYPNTPEFSERLINFTRSFGQKDQNILAETANLAAAAADFQPNSAESRTRAGEIFAEAGNYESAHAQWEKLPATASGDAEIYLDTATVYWDYFQYDKALETITNLRRKFGDRTLYAFETGAILETQHKDAEAVGEYVKALDANRDETQKSKAIKRLSYLSAQKKNKLENVIETAFLRERGKRKDSSFLSLGYAEFLTTNKQPEKAESVLNQAIGRSANDEFLAAARDFYQSEDNNSGEEITLQRLSETAKNPRRTIGFRLELAENYAGNQKRDAARNVLETLVRQFPTNYGVLTESSDFFNRLGFAEKSAQVLENALPKSRGAYRSALSGKLAERLIQLNKLDSAERILTQLHDEDKANIEIFDELTRLYVRTNKPDAMRKAFSETVAELKNSDGERREIEAQIADLRTAMIDALTRLKDYKSAVEQHIEIINREPENEDLTEAAIKYVERYGGAETLVGYYEKTAAESFKNYRWNVVLARIYTAAKNDEQAVKNYRTAIINQPEMPELYLAVADLETKRGNYDEAIENVNEVLELTNNQAEYVKKKIEILKKAGRLTEIEAETAKLPAEEKKNITPDEFAEAEKLRTDEPEKAREIYRAAFEKLAENPLNGELRAADIAAYTKSMREVETLNVISKKLWDLRENLTAIADRDNSTDAGAARKRLTILDGALVESIAATAGTFGTDEELQKLHEDWRQKIENTSISDDLRQTVSLIQNLSRRAGFGDLEEAILVKKAEAADSNLDSQTDFRNLVSFYNERGAYRKTFDLLEQKGSDDSALKAETAKLAGNQEKELEALRAIYWKPNAKMSLQTDENVARYLEILDAENSEELESLTQKSSAYQLQLINFLLGKGAGEFAHAAIENSNFPTAWKVSRNAETSLALREFDQNSECYFCAARQFEAIGEMIKQTPDQRKFLINDDWFRLTREYGEWLAAKNDGEISPAKFLTAMTENQPRNADEQFNLGEFYFAKGELKNAVEHLRLAVENDFSNDSGELTKWATLGAAYFKIGRNDYAEDCWARVLEDESVESGAIYFQVLQKYGLTAKAREKLLPLIVKFLSLNNAQTSPEFQKLIRAVAASFENEREKSAYFQAILVKRPADLSLGAMLLDENLLGENERATFYRMLVRRTPPTDNYDYDFRDISQRVWTKEDAASVADQENEYKTKDPADKRSKWQKNLVELLIKQRENFVATEIIAGIEKDLDGRYALPAWLIEAKIRLEIRAGKFNETAIKRFVGITVSDSVTKIKPPDAARFNEVLQILKDENRPAEAISLSEAFFARMLALGQFGTSNFTGLARSFFQKGDTAKSLEILRLMVESSVEDKRESALAEIAEIDEIKAQTADAAKISAPENNSINTPDALEIAAEIAAEFKQMPSAIAFRREILAAKPSAVANKIELAKILGAEGENDAAQNILTQIIADKNSPRRSRWLAREILQVEVPNVVFDSFSQFYTGKNAEKSAQNETAAQAFINSLIAEPTMETTARQELIKIYALNGESFAALKLAETDKSAKSDELLDALSSAAEKTGNFVKAIEFENARSAKNVERITKLQQLQKEKNARATEFTVDTENTRKL